jgi:hypothetical protein
VQRGFGLAHLAEAITPFDGKSRTAALNLTASYAQITLSIARASASTVEFGDINIEESYLPWVNRQYELPPCFNPNIFSQAIPELAQ